MAVEITKENFSEKVMETSDKVLVDFWASWCSPCRMLSPVIDEIASENHDGVVVAKVNVDEQPELAAQFRVMSIPTMLVFHKGEIVNRLVGVQSKASILNMLQS